MEILHPSRLADVAIDAIDAGLIEVDLITIDDGLDAAVVAGRLSVGEATRIRTLYHNDLLNGAEGPDY